MKQREDSFNKLFHAFSLYVRQQNERLFFGGRSEHGDIADENRRLAGEIIPIIEQYLDEDLVEDLQQMNDDLSISFAQGWNNFFNFWNIPSPFSLAPSASGRRRMSSRYSNIELQKIVTDFSIDLNNRRNRDSKKFTPADLQDMIKDLEKDLQETLFKESSSTTEKK